MKHNSPQLGFNNNVRHRGRVFHIQTEDSGVKHPHIITHLFADGGRILKSTKTSYAEYLGEEELSKKVRGLMQEQHKAMFIALRAGKFDQLIGDVPAEAGGGEAGTSNGTAESSLVSPQRETSAEVAIASPRADTAPSSEPISRAPMTSLSGATEFARADIPPGPPSSPAAVEAEAAPNKSVAPLSPRSRPTDVAHADTIAMPAVNASPVHAARAADPVSDPKGAALRPRTLGETQPKRAAVAPPPAAKEGGSHPSVSFPAVGAERSPAARLTPPPQRHPDASREAASLSPLRALGSRPSPPHAFPAPASGVGDDQRGFVTPDPSASPASSHRTAPAMAKLERPGTRAPSVPPPPPAAAPGRDAARPPLSASLDLDLEALERAAEQSQAPVYQQIRNLPPPPSSLLKSSAPRNTSYRSVTPQATQIVGDGKGGTSIAPPPPPGSGDGRAAVGARPPAASPPSIERARPEPSLVRDVTTPQRPPDIRGPAGDPRSGSAPTIPRAPSSHRGASRYAPSRPASIFGNSRPAEGSSIFGEDLISEKSLDEVILSYLAEDLEPASPGPDKGGGGGSGSGRR